MRTYTFRTLPNQGHITVRAGNDQEAFNKASAEADLMPGVDSIEFQQWHGDPAQNRKDSRICGCCGEYSSGGAICRACVEVLA